MERKTGLKASDIKTTISNRFLMSQPHVVGLTEAFQFLSERCYQIEGTKNYRFFLPMTNEIVKTASLVELKSRMYAEYIDAEYMPATSTKSAAKLSKELIERYINSFLMTVKGDMAMPLAGPIASWKNCYYLNTFTDMSVVNNDPITSDEEALLEQYIKLLSLGLFNITEYEMTLEKFRDITVNHNFTKGSKEELIEFVFSWISNIYHRPGVCLPTVPCFFGRRNGTGKGTFTSIISRMIGNCLVNESQTDSNFNSLTDGKLIIVYNEVKDLPGFYEKTIKGDNTDDERSIERKGFDRTPIVNIMNLILCSNNLVPFKIDHKDRRLTVIQTLNDDSYDINKMIEDFRLSFPEDSMFDVMSQILSKFIRDVDYTKCKSLYNAISTEAKSLMEDSYKSPVERFFEDEDVIFIDYNNGKKPSDQKKTSIKKLEVLFNNWLINNEDSGLVNSVRNTKTKESFRAEVKKLGTEKKYIEKKGENYSFTDTFYEEHKPALTLATEEPVRPTSDKLEAIIKRIKK